MNRILTGLLLLICGIAAAQPRTDSEFAKLLKGIAEGPARSILTHPDSFRVQIIYTQINRDAKGKPSFKHHYFHVDPDLYFNPASMVKMPLAFLSLEKLKSLEAKGVNRHTWMQIDSSYPRQRAMRKDISSEDSMPSIAHFIKRALLISENDPYNRMYQFLGQGPINRTLQQKGYTSTRIVRQFMGLTDEENRHTNRIVFLNKQGKVVYDQPPAYNRDSISFPKKPILVGRAHMNRNEELVATPFDFTKQNNISLEDMQQLLQAVIFPSSVPAKKRFDFRADDRNFLLQYLSQYPSETNYPKYDDSVFYDSYVKFFFHDSTHRMPEHVRVFNKVGWAYGFLTDVSYVIDTVQRVDYFLSATVYVNSDGVVNDSKYDEETMGFPFFRALGKLIHAYELSRPRKYQPSLNIGAVRYEKRDHTDTRPAIREADN
jgi:hypothetical protein